MLEEARALGELRKQGWAPKRTIIYCAWDGEEPALLGSTEWAETHAAELQQNAVVYLNTDGNGRGFLQAEGSHTLEHFINDVARDITDPETNLTVWKRTAGARDRSRRSRRTRRRSAARADWRIGALGSGSDYTPFLQHLGVPTLNIGYGGEDASGIYHSIYDDFYFYTHFLDTDFVYGRALAQTAGTAIIRLADADILPFQFSNLADTVRTYDEELQLLLEEEAGRDHRAQSRHRRRRVRRHQRSAAPARRRRRSSRCRRRWTSRRFHASIETLTRRAVALDEARAGCAEEAGSAGSARGDQREDRAVRTAADRRRRARPSRMVQASAVCARASTPATA